MKGLSLAEMKKISQDDNSATFKHKDGHTIKIATKALSKEMKKKLSELPINAADGVDVPNDQPQPGWVENPDPLSLLRGAPSVIQDPRMAPQAAPQSQEISFSPEQMAQFKQQAPQGVVDTPQDKVPAQKAAPMPKQSAPAPVAPASDMGPPTMDKQNPIPGQTQGYTKSFDDYKKEHESEYAQEDVKFAQDLANGHITPKSYSDILDKNPDGSSKGVLGKIGTLFSLMVGGAGAGLSHQPNAIIGMMDNVIKNDLDAQKKSKDNALNLISLNNQHEMQKSQAGLIGAQTEQSRYNLANMKYNRLVLQHLIDKGKSLSPGTPQYVDWQNQLGALLPRLNNENSNLAQQAAASDAFAKTMGFGTQGQQGGEAAFQQQTQRLKSGLYGEAGVARGKDLEAKHVPGFSGLASEDMSPTSKGELKKMVQYDQQLGRYTDWAKQHSGILPDSPQNIATINQGRTLAKALQSTYRDASLNTVYRPGEQGLLSETIPDDPTMFMNKWRVIPQLDALRAENQAKLQNAAQLEGLGKYVGFGNESATSQQMTPQQINNLNTYMKNNKGMSQPDAIARLKAKGFF